MKRTILLTFFLLFQFISNSQTPTSEFKTWWDKGELYLKKNDYFRAKNVFDYCSKMRHPNSKEAKIKSQKILDILINKETLNRLVNEGKTFEAKKIAFKILNQNSNDLIASNTINNIYDKTEIAINNQVIGQNTTKILKKPVVGLIGNGKTKKLSPSEKELILTPEEITIINTEIKDKERRKGIDQNYSISLNKYNNGDFSSAQKALNRILKLNSNAKKSKKIKEIIENIIGYKNDINNSNRVYDHNATQGYFVKLIQKFDEVNRIDPRFKPFETDINNYSHFLYNHIIETYNGNNCEILSRYFILLKAQSSDFYNDIKIQNIISKCENIEPILDCNFKKLEINELLSLTKLDLFEGSCELAENKLNEIKNKIIQISKNCNYKNPKIVIDSLTNVIKLCKLNNNKIKSQKAIIEEVYIDLEAGKFISAEKKSEKIDSTILNKNDWNSFKRDLNSIKKGVFNEYIDSSSRANNYGYYIDCKMIANRSMKYASNYVDSTYAKKLYFLCDCKSKSKSPENCKEKEFECDTTKINSKSFYLGGGIFNLKSRINSLTYFDSGMLNIGFRNDNLKIGRNLTIGFFTEFKVNFLIDMTYNEVSGGPILNFVPKKPNCSNKTIFLFSTAIYPSYLTGFIIKESPNQSNTRFLGLNNKFLVKIEPQISIKKKHSIISIGYFNSIFDPKKDLLNYGFNLKVGHVF
jgi:hypothetical protein